MQKLLLTMLLSLIIPFTAVAQEAYAVYTNDGTLTFYYDNQKSSRSGKKYAMNTGNNNPGWYTDHRQDIKKVVFNSSFAEARPTSTHCWFSVPVLEGSKLSEIIGIQYLNTSEVTDMSYMFSQCSYLSSIDVTHFNTEKVTDMSFMFYYCDRLTSLDVTHFNTGKVTEMDGMFEHCSKMTSLDVTHFNTENVTSMAAMFQDCSKLMSLDVTHFNTDNLTVMRRMFSGCTSLSSVDLSNFNTKNVTDMFGVFYLCSSIKTIYADEALWSTDKVTNSGSMFYGCTRLVGGNGTKFDSNHVDKVYAHVDGGISYPGYFTSKISTAQTNEAYAVYTDDGTLTFYYDNQKSSRSGTKYALNTGNNDPGWYTDHRQDIKKVVFNSSFASARPTSTYRWFAVNNYPENSTLANITGLQYLNTSLVTTMKYMFHGCQKLTSLDVSKFNTSNVTDMSYMFYDCYHLTSLNLSIFNTSNVTDMNSMFSYCFKLSSLNVSSFDTSKVTDMNSMFESCSGLTSLDLSSFDISNVTDLSWMFQGCRNLTSLDVTHFNTSNVTRMHGMFWSCNSLTSIDVTNFNTSKVADMALMFCNCSGLTNLDLSNFDTNNVTEMIEMFRECSKLTSLDVSHFDTNNVTSMEGMFYKCSGLTSLDLSNFNTSKVTKMYNSSWGGMFQDCTSLKTIYVGDGWNTENVTDSEKMFLNCTSLVGGAGTRYDANHVDISYAHIDGGVSNPGYLTDKNAETDELCDADDLLRFIENLSGNTTTIDNPAEATLCDEPTIDQDVDIEDDLWLYLYGEDDITPPVMNFYGGAINIKSRNGGWTFKGVGFTNNGGAMAPQRAAGGSGGITSVGTLTFDGCTLTEGDYTVQNLSDGRMYLLGGTVVEGSDNLVNSGNAYLDGSVKIATLNNNRGGRIYVTSALQNDVSVRIGLDGIEAGVPIILGCDGYSLSPSDASLVHLILPDGYKAVYDVQKACIFVQSTSGISAMTETQAKVIKVYDTMGRKATEHYKGLRIQRMSDGTVKKVISDKQ